MSVYQGVASDQRSGHKLKANALRGFDTLIMAVAGSAPAYSISATTAFLVAAVGLVAPAALLWSGIPMFGIAFAFNYLGRLDVNAGASYSWVARALHPALGFISGWAVVTSVTIFGVMAALPAGQNLLALFSTSASTNNTGATIVGLALFLLVLGLVTKGIRITAKAQWIMTGIEVGILLVMAIAALLKGGFATSFSWSWFGFSGFGSVSGFAAGAVLAAFYYWGWDVASNLSEETTQSRRNSGRSAVFGVLVVFILFELFTVVISMTASQKDISNSNNPLGDLGQYLWHGTGGRIAILAFLLSTVATIETGLLQATRSLFAMGRDNTIPRVFGQTHRSWNTPVVATLVVGGIDVVLIIASSAIGSVKTVMTDAFNAVGIQISVYYALAGLSVVVAYRKTVFKSVANLVFVGLWPLVGAVFLGWVLYEAEPGFNKTENIVGWGTLGAGLIPLVWYWIKGSSYYQTRPASLDAAAAEEVEGEYTEYDPVHTTSDSGDLVTDL